MKIGFKTSQTNVDWPTLRSIWELGDELTVFDSAWVFDHFVALDAGGGSSEEGWTVLTALAALTKRLHLGHLVLSNTYRHPAVLARMGSTLDHVANGRFILGLGAGWHEAEHEMFGLRLPLIGERISMVESALKVIKGLWESPEGVSVDAPPYRLTNATCLPPPLTEGGPPIWLGLQGKQRGLRITAQYADGWNSTGGYEEFEPKRDALLRHCERLGRDPGEIEISAQAFLQQGDFATLLQSAADFRASGAEHLILVIPAREGPGTLERLAHEVAEPLRERFG
jgi:alkanesulfonate monooxygenase SsuD/methylene tetrahydromethanopterin reductase-like flavin-dependent oxidoreductase (luciferase family)